MFAVVLFENCSVPAMFTVLVNHQGEGISSIFFHDLKHSHTRNTREKLQVFVILVVDLHLIDRSS